MAGKGKKKLQREAKKAQKQATKNSNTNNTNNQPSSSSSSSTSSSNSSNSDNVQYLPAEEWFEKLKGDVLDASGPMGKIGIVMDALLRNTVRMTCEIHAPKFGALPHLLGKNLAFIQLVVIDPDRCIQGKLYMTGSKVDPSGPELIQSSRKLFKDAVPYLLNEGWIFSRSLVYNGYNGMIDEAVKFSEYDPIGDLLDPSLEPSGVRCAEAFLFVAGDFEVKEEGLLSRDAVKELLHELNSKEGISKLLAFDCVAASMMVPKVKLGELNDTHISLVG